MRQYTLLDLREIRDELGRHAGDKDSVTGWCTFCGEEIGQGVDECNCGVSVVWKNSPLWRARYGDPRKAELALTLEQPEDDAGKYLMLRAGVMGFSNQTEIKRWNRATRNFSQTELKEIVRHCARRTRARGLVAYVLNTTDKRLREAPKRRKAKPPPAENDRIVPRRLDD